MKTLARKTITTVAVLFITMFTLSAFPKVTVLDTGCGNTPEYVARIMKSNNLEYSKEPISKELSKYVYMFNFGTFVIEENGEKALISVYNGKPIYGARVVH